MCTDRSSVNGIGAAGGHSRPPVTRAGLNVCRRAGTPRPGRGGQQWDAVTVLPPTVRPARRSGTIDTRR